MSAPALLRARIADLFQRAGGAPLTEREFDGLARDVFAFQYNSNGAYRAYCDRRAITPARVTHWTEIPAVPTGAFKEVALVSGEPARAKAVFRTSGTTRGSDQRGAHYLLDLDLYERSALATFGAYVLPDHASLPFFSLVPPVSQAPDSSLGHMIAVVAEKLASAAEWFVDAEAGLDLNRLLPRLAAAEAAGEPVCMLGTSFAFVHLLDHLAALGRNYQLPEGSRIMDTGGFKGRSRVVAEPELRAAYHTTFGIAETHVVNEYGMTELCSQFYDNALRQFVRSGRQGIRCKEPPPWVRTRVVDPQTLDAVTEGAIGILQHFDLANLFSVMAIQTEDLGREVQGGFVTLGRVQGAAPRGCSIAMDLLLEANRRRP